MTDAVSDLAHDHEEINRLVLSLAGRMRGLDSAASSRVLEESLGEVRDVMFDHFAREEEGLFPFVSAIATDLEPQIRTMLDAHDSICGALSRVLHQSAGGAAVGALLVVFDRFMALYAEHSKMESSLLSAIDARLDHVQRATLGTLVAALQL